MNSKVIKHSPLIMAAVYLAVIVLFSAELLPIEHTSTFKDRFLRYGPQLALLAAAVFSVWLFYQEWKLTRKQISMKEQFKWMAFSLAAVPLWRLIVDVSEGLWYEWTYSDEGLETDSEEDAEEEADRQSSLREFYVQNPFLLYLNRFQHFFVNEHHPLNEYGLGFIPVIWFLCLAPLMDEILFRKQISCFLSRIFSSYWAGAAAAAVLYAVLMVLDLIVFDMKFELDFSYMNRLISYVGYGLIMSWIYKKTGSAVVMAASAGALNGVVVLCSVLDAIYRNHFMDYSMLLR